MATDREVGQAVHAALETRPVLAHSPAMDTVSDKTPPGWVTESLERSEARIESGQTVPIDPLLNRLRTSIARMKAARPPKKPKTAREA